MDSLVIRIPLPADVMSRSKLIVAVETAIEQLAAVTATEIKPVVESEPRKRKAKEPAVPAASDAPPGQTDIEQVLSGGTPGPIEIVHPEPEVETPPAPSGKHKGAHKAS